MVLAEVVCLDVIYLVIYLLFSWEGGKTSLVAALATSHYTPLTVVDTPKGGAGGSALHLAPQRPFGNAEVVLGAQPRY